MNEQLQKYMSFKCDMGQGHINQKVTHICLDKQCRLALEKRTNSGKIGSMLLCSECLVTQHSRHRVIPIQAFIKEAKRESSQNIFDLNKQSPLYSLFEQKKTNVLSTLVKLSQKIAGYATIIKAKEITEPSDRLLHQKLVTQNLQHQERIFTLEGNNYLNQSDFEGLLKDVEEGVTKNSAVIREYEQSRKEDEISLKEMEIIQLKLSQEATRILNLFERDLSSHVNVKLSEYLEATGKSCNSQSQMPGKTQLEQSSFEQISKLFSSGGKNEKLMQNEIVESLRPFQEDNESAKTSSQKIAKQRLLEIQSLNPHNNTSKTSSGSKFISKQKTNHASTFASTEKKPLNYESFQQSGSDSAIKGYNLLSSANATDTKPSAGDNSSAKKISAAIFASIFPSSASKIFSPDVKLSIGKLGIGKPSLNSNNSLGRNIVFVNSSASAPQEGCLQEPNEVKEFKAEEVKEFKAEEDKLCLNVHVVNKDDEGASEESDNQREEDEEKENENQLIRGMDTQGRIRVRQGSLMENRKERRMRKREQKKLKKMRMQHELLIEERVQQNKLRQVQNESKLLEKQINNIGGTVGSKMIQGFKYSSVDIVSNQKQRVVSPAKEKTSFQSLLTSLNQNLKHQTNIHNQQVIGRRIPNNNPSGGYFDGDVSPSLQSFSSSDIKSNRFLNKKFKKSDSFTENNFIPHSLMNSSRIGRSHLQTYPQEAIVPEARHNSLSANQIRYDSMNKNQLFEINQINLNSTAQNQLYGKIENEQTSQIHRQKIPSIANYGNPFLVHQNSYSQVTYEANQSELPSMALSTQKVEVQQMIDPECPSIALQSSSLYHPNCINHNNDGMKNANTMSVLSLEQIQQQIDFTNQLKEQLERKIKEEHFNQQQYSQSNSTKRLQFQLLHDDIQDTYYTNSRLESPFSSLNPTKISKVALPESISSPIIYGDVMPFDIHNYNNNNHQNKNIKINQRKKYNFDDISPILYSPGAQFSPVESDAEEMEANSN